MDVLIFEDGQTTLAKHAKKWGEQWEAAKAGRKKVKMPLNPSQQAYLKVVWEAGQKAGKAGTVMFLVGHGADATSAAHAGLVVAPNESPTRVGMVDLATSHKLRVETDTVFYNDDPDGSGPAMSQQRHDKMIFDGAPDPKKKQEWNKWFRQSDVQGAISRASVWNQYLFTGMYLKANGVKRVVFLTCKVGGASQFIQKIAKDWQVEIQAYNRKVASQEDSDNKVRLFLEGDKDGSGTNTVTARTEIPSIGFQVAKP